MWLYCFLCTPYKSNPIATYLPVDLSWFRPPQPLRAEPYGRLLREFLTARVRTEVALEDMLSDRASDGSPLDPNRDYEDDFNRLSQQYEDLNIAMFTTYAIFLDTTPRTLRKIAPPSLLLLLPR